MRCDACQQVDAVIHLTRITDGESKTLHLCGPCAAQRGITAEVSLVSGPAGSVTPSLEELLPAADRAMLHCSECGATLADIQRAWRLGCTTCWSTFEGALRDVIRQVHGSTRHVGKEYSTHTAANTDEVLTHQQKRILGEALASAVAAERFEDAAVLRDQLRTMEQ